MLIFSSWPLNSLIVAKQEKNGKIADPVPPLYRKYALSLQLQTAQILSAHATLDQKMRSIQDLKEQKNK
jgi:hypothetical protein